MFLILYIVEVWIACVLYGGKNAFLDMAPSILEVSTGLSFIGDHVCIL